MPEAKTGSILVAEDNEMNQKLISVILSKAGIPYTLVDNGIKAIEMYQTGTFQIVLMDCQMPLMDGLLATKKIREFEKDKMKKRVPIVALTANAMKGDKEKCLAIGMDDFLSKPFRMIDLLKVIEKWS